MQKLNEGEGFTVKTSAYGMKVGADIDAVLTGRVDWAKLVGKIAEAFQIQIQDEIYASFVGAAASLPNPTQFNITNPTLNATTKNIFDELLSDVSAANGGAEVVIMGLAVDLKRLDNLTDVNWRSASQKEEHAALGRLGSYEGTALVEIPQRFVKNDVTRKLITPGKLYIFANTGDKFIKFVDMGTTEVYEVTEKGERNDDFQTYEVKRELGIDVILTRYFGVWNI